MVAQVRALAAAPPTPTLRCSPFGATQPYPPGTAELEHEAPAVALEISLAFGRLPSSATPDLAVPAEARRLRRDTVDAVGTDESTPVQALAAGGHLHHAVLASVDRGDAHAVAELAG